MKKNNIKQEIYKEFTLKNTEKFINTFIKINEQYIFLMGSSHISNTQFFHIDYFYGVYCHKNKIKTNTCM